MIIIMIEPAKLAEASVTDENHPDLIIHQFKELLNVFPVLENQPLSTV
jgi:hypothetical protein